MLMRLKLRRTLRLSLAAGALRAVAATAFRNLPIVTHALVCWDLPCRGECTLNGTCFMLGLGMGREGKTVGLLRATKIRRARLC